MRTATSIVATVIRRYALALALCLGLVAVVTQTASAQFLCSAGLRDGQTCEGDGDCTGGGVCIIPQGVCEGSDAELELCSCAGSECVAEPVCADNQSLGTCASGVFVDLCCDLAFNCTNEAACLSTQKLCIGGDLKGYPCVNNDNCPGSLCRSTGKYCAEGDNDSYSCVDDDDCPDGVCVGAAVADTPTPTIPGPSATPRSATPTAVATSTRTATPAVSVTPITPATVAPTATGTRPTAGPTTTRTPSGTPASTPPEPTNTPRPTLTPGEGEFATTTTDVATGGNSLQLDIPADKVTSFPVEGVVQINGQSFGFTRRRTSQILNLTTPDGLPFSVSAGTVVLVIDATPRPSRPGGVGYRNEQGGSCAIRTSADRSASTVPLLLGIVLLGCARRLRRRD